MAEVMRSAVIKAFRSLSSLDQEVEDDAIVEKCQRLCQEHDLSPTDLAYKWEAHVDKLNLPTAPFPELRHFESIESALKKALRDKDSKAAARTGKTVVKVMSRVVVNKDTIGQLQDQLATNYGSVTQKFKLEAPAAPDALSFNSFVTPAKRGRPSDTPGSLPASSRPRMLPTPARNDLLATPAETPESAKYTAREEKFKIMSTMNEALAAAVPMDRKSSRCETKLLQGIQLYKGGRPVVHRYMFERVEQKCMTLRDRLRSITDGIILRNSLQQKAHDEDGCELQMSPVNMPAQDKAWYCGRICCEGDNGSINASSVLLEGANGKRVRLELSHVVQFAVFPGQIVVLRGNNTSGESIIVREMWSDATLPMAKTPADKMATWNETEAFLGGMPLSIMMASGPFTSSADLTYKPLQDLLDHAAQQKPDVLILTGPFVDCKHRQLNPETAGTVGGFNDPPDSLQVVRHVMRDLIAERMSAGSPTTTCVLIPCLEDLHSRTTFPQPPFDQAEIIQAMDGEMDVAQRVDVQLVGNPCILRINEILVGICTADPIRSLSSNEASRYPGDRLTRLVSHVVQQRSFYPLFPPAEGCQMSTAHASHLSLQQTPDILLLPSMLNAFTKRVGDVLCVNPGKLTKGSGPGTFARLTIHPIVRYLRSGPAGGSRKVTAGLAVSPSALVDSPDKGAEGEASNTAAAVSPQQLSQNFESAASSDTKPKDGAINAEPLAAEGEAVQAEGDSQVQSVESAASSDTKPKDGDINVEPLAAEGEAAQAEGDSQVAAAGEDKVADSVAPAPDDKMEVDSAVAAKAEGEGAAAVHGIDAVNVSSDNKAPLPVRKNDTDESKAEVAHRVCERTRVDLVRI